MNRITPLYYGGFRPEPTPYYARAPCGRRILIDPDRSPVPPH